MGDNMIDSFREYREELKKQAVDDRVNWLLYIIVLERLYTEGYEKEN